MKRFLALLNDDSSPVRDRIFILLASVSLIGLLVLTVNGFIIGESAASLIIMTVCFFLFLGLTVFGVKYRYLNIMAPLMAIITSCVLVPFIFFTGGGVCGGSPLWFIFAALLISLVLTGTLKIVLLALNLIVAGICYIVGYLYPELVSVHDRETAYQDSYTSIFAICIMVSVMISFTVYSLNREMKRTEDQKEEIDSLNKSQNRFFSSMSHEIRTPINTIIGLNEMILREDISEEVRDDAENINSASKILLTLINDILDMSKIESGQMTLTKLEYSTGGMLSDIVGMIWVKAKEKNLDFHISVDPSLPAILIGDEVRLKQILINVLSNSVKYTASGSVTLSVGFRKTSNKTGIVSYTISDTGIGIKRENIPHLFSAFKRMDEERNRHIEGTGLGLSIVRQLVDLMNGNVTVNSIYTKGATFIIEIPQEISGSAAVGALDLEKGRSRGFNEKYIRKFEAPDARILAVDDNPMNLTVVSKLLRETKVQVETAISASEALKLTQENSYDLIFMDHLMPQTDGIECMRQIKEQPGGMSKSAKFIVLTANAGSENEILYSKAGFDGYLLKPVSGAALEDMLILQLPKDLVYIEEGGFSEDREKDRDIVTMLNRVNVLVTTESCCDLPAEFLKSRNIPVIPYHLITESGDFYDGIEAGGRGLVDFMTEGEGSARTLAPNMQEYEDFFASCLLRANNIIHITMSRSVSKSYERAIIAAESFGNVKVVDSGSVSSGLGLAVLEADKMIRNGLTPDEIVHDLSNAVNRIRVSFMVDDTKYLTRAGLISSTVNRLVHSFYIRPMLVMRKGRMVTGTLFLGGTERVWERYIRSVFRNPERIDRSELYVTYVGLPAEALAEIEKTIKKYIEFREIVFKKASSAISANCGPGTFGLIFREL